MFKAFIRWCLRNLYKVEVHGSEHLTGFGDGAMIVANHTSLLDGVLLWAFVPKTLTFAINTNIARNWYVRGLRPWIDFVTIDPINPLSLRTLIHRLEAGGNVVIFPEGRITVTGTLMKVYHGPGLVAVKACAPVVPVAIEGAQYTPLSRLHGKVRLRWFPRIRLTVMPPRRLQAGTDHGRDLRESAGRMLADIMAETIFAAADLRGVLFERLLDARRIYGGDHVVIEDIERRPMSYDELVTRAVVLGRVLARQTQPSVLIGVLLPNSAGAAATFVALHAYGRVPVMLNYSAGATAIASACRTAQLDIVVTSHRFIERAKLQHVVDALAGQVRIFYLEDIAAGIGIGAKLAGGLISRSRLLLRLFCGATRDPEMSAVVLFTSGTEGEPKGVVLSHANLLANVRQIAARIDFNAQDVVLNALPIFHSFGLTGGTLLPLLHGMRIFFYPSPLHYRVIPEIAYDINATVLFGTSTFLAGYGQAAHPYDFYSVRYVFAGAEKLRDEVRLLWQEKFGLRIFEGYGATETSPVIAANTPIDYRPGTVGRILPGIEIRLQPVEGLAGGARLLVRGPNVMTGYFLPARPGVIVPPAADIGPGWYDTGDIVSLDDEGFMRIQGRLKRFAKVGGEMVSLTVVEALAGQLWPEAHHAAVAVPDARRGEEIVLVTERPGAERSLLVEEARRQGVSELHVPRRVVIVNALPLLGSGKIDYIGTRALVG